MDSVRSPGRSDSCLHLGWVNSFSSVPLSNLHIHALIPVLPVLWRVAPTSILKSSEHQPETSKSAVQLGVSNCPAFSYYWKLCPHCWTSNSYPARSFASLSRQLNLSCMSMCSCTWGSEGNLGCHSSCLLPDFLETRSLASLELAQLSQLVREPWISAFFYLSSSGITGTPPQTQLLFFCFFFSNSSFIQLLSSLSQHI